jgi:hypothetical protein
MKDILVDNNIAKNFCNPLDEEYKRFIKWLFCEGSLVVSTQLIVEYHSSCERSGSLTNVMAIIDKQQKEGRLRHFSSKDLRSFKFKPKDERQLLSNKKDRSHIKAVMLSRRKFALSRDQKFRADVNNFPGYSARAEARPEDIPYSA